MSEKMFVEWQCDRCKATQVAEVKPNEKPASPLRSIEAACRLYDCEGKSYVNVHQTQYSETDTTIDRS